MSTNSKYWALKRQTDQRSNSSGGSGDSAVSVTPCERKSCLPNDTQFMSLYYSLAPVIVNSEKTFHVLAQDPTRLGAIRILVTDPSGVQVEAVIEQTPSGFKVQFTPSELGDYSIEIMLGDVPLTDSPLRLRSVSPSVAAHSTTSSQSLMDITGLPPTSIAIPVSSATLPSTSATVKTESHRRPNAGTENHAYLFSPPDQKSFPVQVRKPKGKYEFPQLPADYAAMQVPSQAMKAEYVSADTQNMPPLPHKVRAYGDGLSAGRARDPAVFLIDTRGAGRGNIDLTIEGPSEARVNCYDNGDGTCTCTYFPTLEGPYRIAIQYAGTHIPGSPFGAVVAPAHPPSPPPHAVMAPHIVNSMNNDFGQEEFMLIEAAGNDTSAAARYGAAPFK